MNPFKKSMKAQQVPVPYARSSDFHPRKEQLLGNQAGHAAPAWRPNAPVTPTQTSLLKGKAPAEGGSRIFLSRLPVDVGEKEVEELFNKTVGPLRESFLVYNSQGRSKGMAVVTFQRPGDALVARAKYNGRIVDGRRGIKIEIMVDSDMSTARPQAALPTPTLFDRLAPPPTQKIAAAPSQNNTLVPTGPRQHVHPKPAPAPLKQIPVTAVKEAAIPPRRFKSKKGPKRLKKQQQRPVTVADLDKEMEDYRASAPDYLGL